MTISLVMRMLHNKIWIQSLPAFLWTEDSSLEALSVAYCRDTFALAKYGIGGQLANMPCKYLEESIACLQQLDADCECNRLAPHHFEEQGDQKEEPFKFMPALTPVEKLVCVRDTLDKISRAADKYMLDVSLGKPHQEGKHDLSINMAIGY